MGSSSVAPRGQLGGSHADGLGRDARDLVVQCEIAVAGP